MIKITLFSQLVQLLPRNKFQKVVNKYQSNKHSKGLDSWTHLISMVFCQIAQANSVRDISNGLRSITGNLNHLGLEKSPSKSSMSYINKHRDWRVFKDYYFELLEYLKGQYNFKRIKLTALKRKIFILDSTTIPLCLSLYDWARFRRKKGAVKLHLLLDYDGCLPVFAHVTDGKKHDVQVAKQISLPSGSVILIDKAYIDFQWLNILDSNGCFFVTRAKDNMDYEIVNDYNIYKKDEHCVLQDMDILLEGVVTSKKYHKKLRVIRFWDEQQKRELTFLTNNLSWTATTIAKLYKARWEIEIFFKHIKQNLKIKSFVGTSENAVMIQIWTALITMLLLLFLKAKATYKWHLSNLITFIRLNLFVKIDLFFWLNRPFYKPEQKQTNQMALFSG
ncbi:IS4 family transposase [candidate division KSB1 bacterium]